MPCVLARPQCIMFPSTYNNSPLLPAGAVALLGLAFGLPRHIMPPLPLDCPSCFSLPPCPPCRFCGASRACRRPATPSFRCWGDRQPCSSRSHTSCWSLSRCGAGGGGGEGGSDRRPAHRTVTHHAGHSASEDGGGGGEGISDMFRHRAFSRGQARGSLHTFHYASHCPSRSSSHPLPPSPSTGCAAHSLRGQRRSGRSGPPRPARLRSTL